MKQNRGAAGLLILAEIIILIAVSVLGAVRQISPSRQSDADRVPGAELNAGTTENAGFSDEPEQAGAEVEAVSDEDQISEPENFSAEVEQKLSEMTLEEKVAQLFVVSPEQLTGNELVNIAGAGTRNAIEKYPVGGLVYTRDNYQGREQFRDLLTKAEQYSYERMGLYLFLLVREKNADSTTMTVMSQSYDADPFRDMMAANQMTGENILTLPVFPEQQEDITAEQPWVLLSNQTALGIGEAADEPCSFSAEAVAELRNTIGYRGVIVTGSLSDAVITERYSAADAAVRTVQAGADMIYCPADFSEAYNAVLDAVEAGEITEEQINRSVGHILTQKFAISAPTTEIVAGGGADVDAANAEANADAGNAADVEENADAGNVANAENNGAGA